MILRYLKPIRTFTKSSRLVGLAILLFGLHFQLEAQVVSYNIPRDFTPGVFNEPTPQTGSDRVVWADFNGDGILDRAQSSLPEALGVPNYFQEDNLRIFLGLPGGGENLVASYLIKPDLLYDGTFDAIIYGARVRQGDFNQDGIIDLALGLEISYPAYDDSDGYVYAFLGKGDGTFIPLPYIKDAFSLTVANLNQDGQSELLSVHSGVLTIHRFSIQSGAFITISQGSGQQSSIVRPDVIVEDLNGDNQPEIFLRGRRMFDYQPVFPISPDGTIQAGTNYFFDTSTSKGVRAADVNQDGLDDILVISSQESDILSIYLNQGNQSFQPTAQYTFSGRIGSLLVGNINDDAFPDLAFSLSQGQGKLPQLLVGNGLGQFSIINAPSATGQVLALTDLDQDNRAELVLQDQMQVRIYTNNGSGQFSLAQSLTRQADQADAGDFNGDGVKDLLLGQNTVIQGSATSDPSFTILFGMGNNQFGGEQALSREFYFLTNSVEVLVNDFNQDGFSDFVYNGDFVGVNVNINNGQGSFNIQTLPYFGSPYETYTATPLVGDVNGDGKPDIVRYDQYVQYEDSRPYVFSLF
ncbi:MAG: VCBS repeat-containing protein [Bacteroidia bacterium]|nr:VCBS repeat-containing protein [Bacteroidia bacterium]